MTTPDEVVITRDMQRDPRFEALLEDALEYDGQLLAGPAADLVMRAYRLGRLHERGDHPS